VSVTVYAPDMTVASKQEVIWDESVQEMEIQSFMPNEMYVDKAFLIEADVKKDNCCLSRTVYFVSCTSMLADIDTYAKYRKRPEKTLYFQNGPWLKPSIQSGKKAALKILNVSEKMEGNYTHQYVTIKNEAEEQKTVCITMESDKLEKKEKITISAWNSESITL